MVNSITKLAILGSTGSIGRQTLQVVRNLAGRFRVVGLAAGQNLELLSEQIAEFKPEFIYHQPVEKSKLISHNCKLLSMEEMAGHPDVDVVIVATSGKAGLFATLAAVKAGKKVAIANKEPLVMAGEIITREAQKSGARLLPIDSVCRESEEHAGVGTQQDADRVVGACNGEIQVTVADLVAQILAAMGSSMEPVILNEASNEIRHQYLSAEKARRVLGWSPLFTLAEGLDATIEWYREFLA